MDNWLVAQVIKFEYRVKVGNEKCGVNVYQTSKAVWIAAGSYKGEAIECKAHRESTALKRWMDAARTREC